MSGINQKYRYQSIKEIEKFGDASFYGVIYDATFPVQEEKDKEGNQFYTCTLKIIDPEVNCVTFPNNLNDHMIYLIVKSVDKETLPYVHSVGDIIRVHRGYLNYKKKKCVYLNFTGVFKVKASWCIFPGSVSDASDYNPIACSSNNYTFESQDKQRIDNLRSWIKIYFSSKNSLVYGKEFKLINRSQSNPGDNDVLVQVVQKKEFDDQVVYFVQDETDGCELHTFKYFGFVDVNDVIRIRSFKVADRNIILMNKFSNILKIPTFSSLYREMLNKIAEKTKTLDPNADVPVFSTTEEKKFDDLMMVETPTNWGVTVNYDESKNKLRTLNEIIDTNEENFVLHLNIMSVYPQTIYDCVSVICQKCHMSTSTKDIEEEIPQNEEVFSFTCKICKTLENGKLYYNCALVGRENSYSSKLITLYLSSYDDQGASFFGIPPTDLFRNSSAYQQMKGIIEKLTSPDCYVSVLVEAFKTGHSESDRIYRIIGAYQNNLV